ncbi:hypothetical protein PV328_006817 [Microctonus aethiopoides]|uniref:Odorant receptor n=1 Tax=Microctonus aethiopoides TaxID=144406 RepID=A0AA39KU29_9HYME|nr:hypothetical protein PV328_006817 [Microctonus aethiopoides]
MDDLESQSTKESSGFLSATKQTRWIFSMLGVWSMMTKNTTVFERRLFLLIQIICQVSINFIIAPAFFHLYYCNMNIKMKIALLGPVGFAVACYSKYMTIIYRRREIYWCIKQMETDWNHIRNTQDIEIMIKNMKIGKEVTILCATFMYTGGISHQIMVPFLPGSIISILDNSTKRLLVYPVYDSIFDTQMTPIYEIVYSTHIFTGVILCTISIGACHLSILFITHISGQNEMMIWKLENLIKDHDTEEKNINERIAEIIRHHHRIIKFATNVEKSLREICLLAIIEALFIICTAQYYSMTAWKNNETFGTVIYLTLVEAFIINCFIFCHVGELSKRQFHKVGEAAYMTEWHRLSLRNARAMFLIIAATQNPPKMTAGGLMELSYNGFVSVLKTTAAYFNIMRMVEF